MFGDPNAGAVVDVTMALCCIGPRLPNQGYGRARGQVPSLGAAAQRRHAAGELRAAHRGRQGLLEPRLLMCDLIELVSGHFCQSGLRSATSRHADGTDVAPNPRLVTPFRTCFFGDERMGKSRTSLGSSIARSAMSPHTEPNSVQIQGLRLHLVVVLAQNNYEMEL